VALATLKCKGRLPGRRLPGGETKGNLPSELTQMLLWSWGAVITSSKLSKLGERSKSSGIGSLEL
jgi:hypothetical protein